MKKEEKIIIQLAEATQSIISIECESCGRRETSWNVDEYYFAEKLFSQGWNIKRNRVICDKCNQ